jgi:hypothetical protein
MNYHKESTGISNSVQSRLHLCAQLDLCMPIFEDTMIYLFKKEQGYEPTPSEVKTSEAGNQRHIAPHYTG